MRRDRDIRRKKKASGKARLLIAVVSFLNLVFSLMTRIYDRNQVIKVLQDPETFETVVKVGREQKKG